MIYDVLNDMVIGTCDENYVRRLESHVGLKSLVEWES